MNNLNKLDLNVLVQSEIERVSAGISLSTVLLLVEIPHAFLIAREATNYIGNLWVNGCQGIEEGDYFTHFFCKTVPQ